MLKDEVTNSYAAELIIELQSNTVEDMQPNLETLMTKISELSAQWFN